MICTIIALVGGAALGALALFLWVCDWRLP